MYSVETENLQGTRPRKSVEDRMQIVFRPRPVIPVENPFHLKGVPSGYLLACTSDSCFCQSVFANIVDGFRAIAQKEEDVCVINTILFISPELAAVVENNPEMAPVRY